MDAARFDALSRSLGRFASRRTALGGLLGSLLGFAAGAPAAGQRRSRRRLGADGPCGNGGPKANRCRRHRDCCTRYCVRQAGRRHGRCRCRQQGERCTRDRNCCSRRGQSLTCQDQAGQRVCLPPPTPTCGSGGPCRVFVTSASYQGDLREGGQGSGIDGADAKCQRLADASPRTAGGTYQAWLSGSTLASSPAERFTTTDTTGPYVLVDDAGTVIARDWADLTDGSLLAPIIVTEHGLRPAAPTNVWTHTLPDGTPGGTGDVHCSDWTSADLSLLGNDGTPDATDEGWTRFGGPLECIYGFHLYCFEQG